MTTTTLVVLIVIVVIALIAIGIGVAMSRRSRMRELPDESKAKYAQSWSAIQDRFIEDPRGAVAEADRMAVALLRDRGVRMEDERNLPQDLMQARSAAGVNAGQSDTEGLRKAMLHYQGIVDDAVGTDTRKEREGGRREVAS